MLRALTLLCCLLIAPRAMAHPHVFVDVGLRFHTDAAGAVNGVEVTWRYDSLFSLLVLSDRGLDMDGDMALTEAERAALLGFDLMDWEDGFDGALFLRRNEVDVPLGSPQALSLELRDGHLVTRHLRPLATPVAPTGLIVRPYDPSYYAALSLSDHVKAPAGCDVRVIPPDRKAADAQVEALGGFGDEATFEEALVGGYYADTLVLSCAQF
jgi:ABC-type uncharacterized transport system substrate-binding protein